MFPAVQGTAVLDVDRLARFHVTDALVLQYIEGNALGSHHVIVAAVDFAFAEYERPDSVRIAERDDAVADDQRSVISEQVEMGVAVRMAVLEALSRHLPNR